MALEREWEAPSWDERRGLWVPQFGHKAGHLEWCSWNKFQDPQLCRCGFVGSKGGGVSAAIHGLRKKWSLCPRHGPEEAVVPGRVRVSRY